MTAMMLVFLGGGLGSVLRWLAGLGIMRATGGDFPFSTLVINLVGCTLMGLFARALPTAEAGGESARLFLMAGLLGGFTTFSTFALDTAGLFERQFLWSAFFYVAASLAFSLLGLAFGLWIAGSMLSR